WVLIDLHKSWFSLEGTLNYNPCVEIPQLFSSFLFAQEQSFLKGWVVRFLRIYNLSHGAGVGTYPNIDKILVLFWLLFFHARKNNIIKFPSLRVFLTSLGTQSLTKLPTAD
ncbi:hypothetical protein ACJX0J_027605, partial [Zea mays]